MDSIDELGPLQNQVTAFDNRLYVVLNNLGQHAVRGG
jgi:hypothetical protein